MREIRVNLKARVTKNMYEETVGETDDTECQNEHIPGHCDTQRTDHPLEVEETRITYRNTNPHSLASISENTLNETSIDFNELNLSDEQAKDAALQQALLWASRQQPVDITYAGPELRKYIKQLPRLQLDNGILYRKFYDDTGNQYHLQLCLPTHLRA